MKNTTTLETVKNVGYTKVWGEHSLTIGEIAGLIAGLLLMWFKPLGSWSIWVGLAVIAISMSFF